MQGKPKLQMSAESLHGCPVYYFSLLFFLSFFAYLAKKHLLVLCPVGEMQRGGISATRNPSSPSNGFAEKEHECCSLLAEAHAL